MVVVRLCIHARACAKRRSCIANALTIRTDASRQTSIPARAAVAAIGLCIDASPATIGERACADRCTSSILADLTALAGIVAGSAVACVALGIDASISAKGLSAWAGTLSVRAETT